MGVTRPKSAREFAVSIYFNDPDLNVLEEVIAERDEQIRLWERAKPRFEMGTVEEGRQARHPSLRERILSRFSQ